MEDPEAVAAMLENLMSLDPQLASWIVMGSGARAGCLLAIVPLLTREKQSRHYELEPLHWFISQAAEGGIPLTQLSNLGRGLIMAADDRYGWFSNRVRGLWKLNRDNDMPEVIEVRRLATRMRAVRRRKRMLLATKRGQALLADPKAMWNAAVEAIVSTDAFTMDAGEIVFACLLSQYPEKADVRKLCLMVGDVLSWSWMMEAISLDSDRFYPGASQTACEVLNLLDALGLIEGDGESTPLWPAAYHLTPAGYGMAIDALRHLA
jgi:hypothetical protein